jgi:sugar-specific transcriptional regulator TrmB
MSIPKELRQALESYGFDGKEAKLYIAGIEKQEATILEFSRHTGFPRTTLYPILENLCRRGYFRIKKQKGHTKYIANPPEMFLKHMQDREARFRSILPLFEALKSDNKETIGVTMYEGTEGFKQFWQQIFRSGVTEYCLLTTGVHMLDYVKEPYLLKQIIAERIKRNIKSRQLTPKNSETMKFVRRDNEELRESRFLPATIKIPATVLIFGNDAAFITTRKENSVILVTSGDVSITLRTMFELLWECAEQTS